MKTKYHYAIVPLLSVSILLSACKKDDLTSTQVKCQRAEEVAAVLGIPSPGTEEAIELSPEIIRNLLINGNMTLLQSANRVHKAKEMLNMARANLLPSLNLAALIQGAASPTFLVASVDILLPFLLPSKWFDMLEQKNLTKAEEMAFLLTQLNLFSSTYALYYALHTDYVARDFLALDIQDALTVERLVSHSFEIGQATSADLDLARSQVIAAQNRQIRLEELLAEELASLRYALAICPDVPLTLTKHTLPASELESLTAIQAAQKAVDMAPESRQLSYLLRAAEMERWSKIFGFLGGAEIGGIANQMGDAFQNLNPAGAVNIGMGYVVGISLSNRNIEAIKLRQLDLGAEILKMVDSVLSRVSLTQERIENSEKSEILSERVFHSEKERYTIGETTLLSLSEIQTKLRQVRLDTIRARADQDLERITLHRLMRTEAFEPIKGCSVDGSEANPCNMDFVKRKLGQKRGK